eukprot:TRINITY_DN17118_c0_g1_i1.p2 TRINITY_DN17118_c0_g1~~TRINITY_DN17118_c0_g1_i1.p2  ORF type:complete len:528 (+),score=183.95 TRINITY_DN17118_c0_g1_i1:43-1626(+)
MAPRPCHTTGLPPGYHVTDDGVTVRPKVRVRSQEHQFGSSRTIDLVAIERAAPGDVLLKEAPLLEWDDEHAFPVPTKSAGEKEMILGQRCAAIKKMSGQMQQVSKYCDTCLPIVHAQCYKKHVARGDADTVWTLPWTMQDTELAQDEFKGMAAFCVLAHRGLSNTIHEKVFPAHVDMSRLVVMAERGALPMPRGKALFKHASAVERMAYVKPKLKSVGSRPMAKRGKEQEVPTPNADYTIDPATGELTLVAKKKIEYGDRITVPKEKTFEKAAGGGDVMSVLKDKSKMEAALLHQAKQADATEGVKNFAKVRHPTVADRLPPAGSFDLAQRHVAGELWREVFLGDAAAPEKPLGLFIDNTFDEKECRQLVGALARSGTQAAFPYHVGFETSTRVVNPQDFSALAQHLFSRMASKLPPRIGGKQLVGVANQAMFLRLTPGEELLEFSTPPGGDPSAHTVPFALALSSHGALTLQKSQHRIALKAGRFISWPHAFTHRVPMCCAGDMIVLFSYLVYSNNGAPKPREQMC